MPSKILTAFLAATALFPSHAFAFDDDVKVVAESPQAMAVSQRFASQMDTYDYAACGNAYVSALALWARGAALDTDAQLQWAIIGKGVEIYRNNFVANYGTTEPIDEAFQQVSGAYYQANMESIVGRCNQILAASFE
jgi:hypothetical protein